MKNKYFVFYRFAYITPINFILLQFFLLSSFFFPSNFIYAQQSYSTINKFLQAKMFCEAYYEILKVEISNPKFDQKLLDLKQKILNPTLKEAEKRQKINPSDEAVYTILADIYLQMGRINDAIKTISVARQTNPNALVHYTFAKILFNKGNISQAFDEMEKALLANPSSEVIFDDFNFLYNCKNSGLVSAQRRAKKENNFLIRAIPPNKSSEISQIIPNPFTNITSENQNNNLQSSETEYESPSNYVSIIQNNNQLEKEDKSISSLQKSTINQDPSEINIDSIRENEDQNFVPNVTSVIKDYNIDTPQTKTLESDIINLISSNNGSPNFEASNKINNSSISSPSANANVQEIKSNQTSIKQEVTKPTKNQDADPENKKLMEADKFIENAKQSISKNNIPEAQEYIKKAKDTLPDYPPVFELESKIKSDLDLDNSYKNAIQNFNNNKFNLALLDFEKVYNANPEKYHEATLYLGKIFVLCPDNRDLKKAKEYFEKFISKENIDPNIKRDIEWIIIGILTDDEQYEEAYYRFVDLERKELEFVRAQNTYWKLKYTLWFNHYKIYVLAGFLSFLGMFLIVLILKIAPNLTFISDPVKVAQEAMNSSNYSKAVEIANNALLRAKLDLNSQKILYEISIQANYNLKNYVKCIEMAQALLRISPENQISYKYIAKAYLATNDTSANAISFYEKACKLFGDKEFLPVLANNYIKKKIFNDDSLDIIFQYFQAFPKDKLACQALADFYTQNKRMSDEVILVLEEAIKLFPEKNEYKELLARNYVKKGMYLEASRICLEILSNDINNTGIHVVYTTCMKKMNLVEEAILQYEVFLQKYPKNQQLHEILNDLKKETIQNKELVENLPQLNFPDIQDLKESNTNFHTDLISDKQVLELLDPLETTDMKIGLSARKNNNWIEEQHIEGISELPLDELANNELDNLPIPDFLKKELENAKNASINTNTNIDTYKDNNVHKMTYDYNTNISSYTSLNSEKQNPEFSKYNNNESKIIDSFTQIKSVPLLDPFSEQLEPINIEDLMLENTKEELKQNTNSGLKLDKTEIQNQKKDFQNYNYIIPSSEAPSNSELSSQTDLQTSKSSFENQISKAKELIKKKKYQEVIEILSPIFATKRSLEVGLVLAEAYLLQNNPVLAKEIIDTVDFDREIMPEIVKDISYKIALALEQSNKIEEALELYDMICNVDINYKDAFERSDRLYTLKKQLHSKA